MNPVKITTFIALAVLSALPSVFAREPDLDSAEAWAGTWKNDHGQTMTISFRGTTAIISYSKGTPDTGKLRGDGDTIEFEGSTAGGYKHSEGTLVLSPDHARITKNQNIFAQDGPTQHLQATYHRTAPRLSTSSETDKVSSRQNGPGVDHGVVLSIDDAKLDIRDGSRTTTYTETDQTRWLNKRGQPIDAGDVVGKKVEVRWRWITGGSEALEVRIN